MREIFIQLPSCLRSSSSGVLSETIYESFKGRIMVINSDFRKWREETKNENNTQINVINIFIILYTYRTIFGNIIFLLISHC